MPLEYSTFVSSFNTTKATLGASYNKITFDDYAQLLEDEQAKLITLGILKSSKSNALVANNESSKNSTSESSNKGKGKKKKWKDNKQGDTKNSSPKSNQQKGKSSSNTNKKGDNNQEKKKCAYCKRTGHDEHQCYHKKIDELKNIMKHNVPFPNSYKEKGSASLDSKRKGKALLTHTVSQGEWIIDLGATHHMDTSK